jgi:hypothetical protein
MVIEVLYCSRKDPIILKKVLMWQLQGVKLLPALSEVIWVLPQPFRLTLKSFKESNVILYPIRSLKQGEELHLSNLERVTLR